MGTIFTFLVPLFYVGLVIILVSGWIRGGHEGRTRDPLVLFSRFGFVLGTNSVLTAVIAAISNRLEGFFKYHDSKASWFYAIGVLFAGLGVVLSMFGLRRRSVLRWHSLNLVGRHAALVPVAVRGIKL